jgi:voltage-gated potassium channel
MVLDVAPTRAWTHGRVNAFVKRHALVWELSIGGLTLVYVVLAFLQDQGSSGLITVGVEVLAAVFIGEFAFRLYDSPSRMAYFRGHWLDMVTCVPVVGPFRVLRLVRLVGFIRLGAMTRSFGVGAAASQRVGGVGLWVLAPILIIVWLAASYGFYELEGGVNPHVKTFADALYFAFVTASTVGYGDVTPVTAEGKVLAGVLIFLGIGLLGFASAQLTAKLLPQRTEIADLKATMDRQVLLIQELKSQLDAVSTMLDDRRGLAPSPEADHESLQVA